MKNKSKITILAIIIGLILFCLTGCNKQIIDTTYSYNKAVCSYGNNTFEIKIKSWNDYDGEQIQVKSKDDTIYLISANRCYLVKE